MKGRFYFATIIALPIALAGCAGPCKWGANFQVFKPPSVSTESLVQPMTTSYIGQGIASGPVALAPAQLPTIGMTNGPALLPMPHASSLPVPPAAVTSSCTMDDLCKGIIAIQDQLRRMGTFQPMPKED